MFAVVTDDFDQKRVFLKTTCSPTDPPNDLQNVNNSPGRTHIDMSPKWALNPQILFGTKISNPPEQPVVNNVVFPEFVSQVSCARS